MGQFGSHHNPLSGTHLPEGMRIITIGRVARRLPSDAVNDNRPATRYPILFRFRQSARRATVWLTLGLAMLAVAFVL